MSPVQCFATWMANIQQLIHDVPQIDLGLIDPEAIESKAGQFESFEVAEARTG